MEKLTDKRVKNAQPSPDKHETLIREGDGFVLRIRPSGTKSFYYIFDFKGKRCRMFLGQYPAISLADAHKKHTEALLEVMNGKDPRQPKLENLDEITVARLKELYVEHIKTNLVSRSVKHQSERLENYLLPEWENRLVKDIRRRDAIVLIEKIANRGKPAAARNVLLAARAMFSYAMFRELVENNPFTGVSKAVPQVNPKPKERYLNDDEIRVVWNAFSDFKASEVVRRALLLILVTAQRPGEVVNIELKEIEIGVGKEKCMECGRCGWWTKPKEKTKNKVQEHRVYLSPLALSLLLPFDGFVFPSGKKAETHIVENSLAHHVQHSNPQYLGLVRWTPHDLRRTARTKLAELGCIDEYGEAILDHKKKGITGVYNRHRYDAEKMEWLMKWSLYLQELVYPAA